MSGMRAARGLDQGLDLTPAGLRAQRGAVNKGCLIGGVVLVILGVVLWSMTVGTYNELVTQDEVVNEKWSGLGSQYQRRYELVPQLVEVVKGAAGFEQETLTAVTDARAQVGKLALPANAPTDPQELAAYAQAQQGLGSALGRLLAVSEAYPQLRATDAFRDLQVQIEGTENRINVARLDYIAAVRTFNTQVRKFPANLVAGLYGFERYPQLETDVAQQAVPDVSFDFGQGEDG